MAHVRRKFVDAHRAQGSAIADGTIKRIAQLYAVEKEARETPPERRAQGRQAMAKSIFDDLEAWLRAQLPRIIGKSQLATAIRNALTRMTRLRPCIDHGILELDNNALRLLNGPCEWSQSGAKTTHSSDHRPAAAPPLSVYTLIETVKLNVTDPQAWARPFFHIKSQN